LQKERFTRIIVWLYSAFLFEMLPNRTINSLPFMEPEDSRWQELTTGPHPKSADSSVCTANLLRTSAFHLIFLNSENYYSCFVIFLLYSSNISQIF